MSRIYSVKIKDAKDVLLVSADTRAGALRHAAEKTMVAEVASQEDMYKAAKAGLEIEDAKVEAPDADQEGKPKKGWPK